MDNQKDKEICCAVKCDMELNETFWSNQYKEGSTGWDLGEVSPPLKEYISQLNNKDLRILIPGCGNTYEAEYLLEQGFTNVTVIDISPVLTTKLSNKFQANHHIKIITGDFFKHDGLYDLILEQTFFCALDPELRRDYVSKMYELLVPGGKLTGLLFDREFEKKGPPFGGNKCAYINLFEKSFDIKTMESCYNSFSKRSGTELFMILSKK